jgi:peptide deformylase
MNLKIYPDPALRTVAAEVEEVNPYISDCLDQMALIMDKYDGIGLAAPQIGLNLRLIIVGAQEGAPLRMINPEIIEKSPTTTMSLESCLSIPKEGRFVERHEWVKVKYTTEEGAKVTIKLKGLASYCVQHEIDHLNGRLIIDGE